MTRLLVVYDGATVIGALIRPDHVEPRLEGVDDHVARLVLTRTEVGDTVATAFHEGRYHTGADREHVAALLLWLACRDNRRVAERARAGGVTLLWRVSPPPDAGQAWDLACSLYDTPETSGPVPESSPITTARLSARTGGHGEKIDAALAALQTRGELPEGLRRKEREKRLVGELEHMGFAAGEMPSKRTFDRAWVAYRGTN